MTRLTALLLTYLFVSLSACNRKTVPTTNASASTTNVSKPVTRPKAPTPKVIVVNDQAAQKTVDGRYYYDVNGKRYYRNNKDGKYYLFNKNMYSNDDFKPVKN